MFSNNFIYLDTGESIGDQFEEDYLRPSSTHLDNETNGHEPMGIYCEPPIDFTKMQVARELVQRVISPQTSTSSRQQPSVPVSVYLFCYYNRT